jgi:hypothetical protein
VWSGPCLGGPMNARDGASRFPSGFILVDKESDLVWIYDYIPYGESPTGGAFQVRMRDGEPLISDRDQPKNRIRAAEEVEFDVRSVGWGLGLTEKGVISWEQAYPTAVYAGPWDMSMGTHDMVTATRRWMAVWSNWLDQRREYFTGFSGWKGSGNAQRWDFLNGTVAETGNDHQWHLTVEVLPDCVDDPWIEDIIMSVCAGETAREWEGR